jgi:hypothetical protein
MWTSSVFNVYLRVEIDKWGRVTKAAGIPAE